MRKEYERFIDELFEELTSLNNIQKNESLKTQDLDLFLEDKNGDLYVEILCPAIHKDTIKIDTVENGMWISYDKTTLALDKDKNVIEKSTKVNKQLTCNIMRNIKEVDVRYRDGIITLKLTREKKDNKIKITGL